MELRNRLKAKLQANEPAYGVSIMIPSPQIVEMIGLLGFDWVLLDCEHGTIGPESLETLAMVAQLAGLTPIARPEKNSSEAILRVLDRGALGVQVPHVNSADDARRAVEAAKYHPLGRRGLAAGSRPARYGFGVAMEEYVQEANRETLVCVQLEEEEALGNVDDILTVPEVDVFFIGPSDLSQSMGHPGRADALPVRDAIDRTFAAIVAAGKVPGSAGNASATRRYLAQGVRYLYTHLTTLLGAGAAGFLKEVRGD